MQAHDRHDQPLVSVIIPNYNHAEYVGDAVRSALAQDYHNHEIIVVDDGSTDDSRTVIAQFGDWVHYIYQENAGLSAARNTGIRASKGSLIGVLDADDMYEPDFLGTLLSALEECPDADGIYCGYQFVDHKDSLLPQIEARPVAPDKLYGALLDGDFFVPESILLHRYVYDNVGLFDESLRACEDWDVWLRATKEFKIIHSNKILTRHRVLPGSMSTDPLRMLNGRLAVLKKHVGEEPIEGNSSPAHRAYGRAYLGSCVEYLQYGDQDRAFECFQKMSNLDPGLLTELDTFYQLGCGDQPKGSMGDLKTLDVKRNSLPLFAMMQSLFVDPRTGNNVKRIARAIYANAYFALGMLSYGTRKFREARHFLWHAVLSRPSLIFDRQLLGIWLRTFLGPKSLDSLKGLRRRIASQFSITL
jgi:glycosyltransferase involved in cell wall biosynthesis